jgi:hypothetical protein
VPSRRRTLCLVVLALLALPARANAAEGAPQPEYVRSGFHWTAGRQITWKITSATTDVSSVAQHDAIAAALDAWARAADLTFVDCSQVACTGTPDIRVLWTRDGAGHPQPGGTDIRFNSSHAHGFPPFNPGGAGLAGDLHLNDALTWSTTGGVNDIRSIATHELGHAVGLDHTQASRCPNRASPTRPIMCPVLIGIDRDLAPDDVAGVRSLYGRPDHAVDGTIRRDIDRASRGDDLVNTTGAGQTSNYSRARGQKARFFVRWWNDGRLLDTFTLRGPTSPAGFTVRYFVNDTTTDITSAVTAGTYQTRVAGRGSFIMRVEVTVKPGAVRRRAQGFYLRATSSADPSLVDVTRAVVNVS